MWLVNRNYGEVGSAVAKYLLFCCGAVLFEAGSVVPERTEGSLELYRQKIIEFLSTHFFLTALHKNLGLKFSNSEALYSSLSHNLGFTVIKVHI